MIHYTIVEVDTKRWWVLSHNNGMRLATFRYLGSAAKWAANREVRIAERVIKLALNSLYGKKETVE